MKKEILQQKVLYLLIKMNKLAQYYFKKEYPNKDEERRKVIDNEFTGLDKNAYKRNKEERTTNGGR